jgi:hypothetical protein
MEIHVLDENLETMAIYKANINTYNPDKSVINIMQGIKNKKVVAGGDDDPITDDIDINMEEFEFTDNDFNTIEDDNIDNKTSGELVLENIRNANKTTRHTGAKLVKTSTNIEFNNTDNIMEVRGKIQLITGIPIYRQHLYYITDDKTIQLSYRISTSILQKIDIRDILTRKQKIENIPVDVNLLVNMNNMVIESFEEFRLLDNIASTKLYLLDLNLFFIDKARFDVHLNDMYVKNLLYYSFVGVYWPMLSIDMFSEYIRNESTISEKYPIIAPDNKTIQAQLTAQDTIYKRMANVNKSVKEKFNNNIFMGITQATLYQHDKLEINLRNLFDKFQLNESMAFMMCKCMINGTPVELVKTFKNKNLYKVKVNLGELLINCDIKLPNGLISNANLLIKSTGDYYVITKWREDYFVNFSNIYDIVGGTINNIIEKINNLGKSIAIRKLANINEWTTQTVNVSISLYLKNSTNEQYFKELLKNIDTLVSARFLAKKGTIEPNTFNILKGVFKFNHNLIEDVVKKLENYYSRFTDGGVRQKWDILFTKSKTLKFTQRYADVKIDIININETERDYIIYYVLHTIYLTDVSVKQQPVKDKKEYKNLKLLKEIDPELYDFKTAYNSSQILSKKCQKQHQPIIVEPDEYDSIPNNRKEKLVKYWNFTKNEDTYYECPNAKYPHLRFVPNIHPKGYCLPCCKKTLPVDDENNAKTLIHKNCLETHFSEISNTVNDKTKGKYVSNFGKDVGIGRLSLLPEEISMLFNEDKIKSSDCQNDDNFYIVGTIQEWRGLNLGVLYSIELIADNTSLIKQICEYVMRNKNVLSQLELSEYYNTREEMLEDFLGEEYNKTTSFENKIIKTNRNSKIINKWNTVIIKIIEEIENINVIIFHIIDGVSHLILPANIDDTDTLFNRNIVFLLKKQSDDDPNVMVYYPIIYANRNEWYDTGSFKTKIFSKIHPAIHNLGDIVQIRISGFNSLTITLNKIKKIAAKYKYNIDSYFINKTNNCYAVMMSKNKTNFYFPVIDSYYTGPNKMYDSYDGNTSIYPVLEFISFYNKEFVKIVPDVWLYINKNEFIGFEANGLNFYGKSKPPPNNAQTKKLYYSPFVINALIVKNGNKSGTYKTPELYKALYSKYIYQLILIEFTNFFTTEKNIEIRQKLKKVLHDCVQCITSVTIKELRIILKDYPNDLTTIKDIYTTFFDSNDMVTLANTFDNTIFSFDKISLNKLRAMDNTKDVYSELIKIAKNIIVEGDVKNPIFPNILTPCSDGVDENYCNKKKLIVPKGVLNKYLEILAADIKNPIKHDLLFSNTYVNNTIDPYNFTEYPHEDVYITLL